MKTPALTKPISTSDGRTRDCRLVIQNVTGIAEERGFRLFWEPVDDPSTLIAALGYATSNPFRFEREARAYGLRHLGCVPKRIR